MAERAGRPARSGATLADADARAAAASELDRTVFVEAGAGSGKTRLLVERVVALVASGVPVGEIAAITFTERAALELVERLRTAFAERCVDAPDGPWAQALVDVDAAAIGTLHSFARRVLAEHALDAGLPPSFAVADDAQSVVAFDRRWRRFAARLLRAPDGDADERARAVRIALAAGVTTTHLRQLTKALDESWDLAAERIAPGEPPPVPHLPVGALLADLDDVVALGAYARSPDDRLARFLERLAGVSDALRAADDDPDRIAVLRTVEAKVGNRGVALHWTRAPGGKADVVAQTDAWLARAVAAVAAVQQAALDHLAGATAAEVVAAADGRRRAGELEFHDLLVLARGLLRHPRHGHRVRAALHARYTRLLLDEFQDTDPIQLELAVLIAADPEAPPDPLPAPVPGRLFFVGDPKQSIYRFRRADIATYLDARRAYGDGALELTVNFRSSAAIVGWVNRVFRSIITEHERSQAAYRPLVAVRAALPGPGVLALGGVHDDAPDAETLRAREALDVAQAIASAIGTWHVDDGTGRGASRPARAGDVAILIPTRTALPALEDALAAAGVPARVEAGSLLLGGDEIAELLTVVRAVVTPADELAVLAALRTTLLGMSEIDLYRHRVPERRSLLPDADAVAAGAGSPVDTTSPVEQALALLGRWHDLAAWASPSVVLGRILDETRGWELAGHEARPRDAARRLRVLVDQARAFAEDTGGTLADWLAWADRQRSDGALLAEPLVPEPDDDAVRILTIHAAKGLEFPITVVAGLTGRPGGRPLATRVLWPAGGGPPEIRLAKGMTSASFDDAADLDAQLDDDERRRLLYVACTRARDHLVVSVHHVPSGDRSLAALAASHGAAGRGATPFVQPGLPLGLAPERPVTPPETDWSPVVPAPPTVVSATALAAAHDGGHAGTLDGAFAAFGEGDPAHRAAETSESTSFGLAVHATLERLAFDVLTTPGGRDLVACIAADSASAEGIDARAAEVADAVTIALGTPILRTAAHAPHWRELYVAAPLGGQLLEGYVDLLVRTERGLALVDYKSDARPPADGVDAHHRVQLAAYAHAIEHALGEPVVDAFVLYCRDAQRAQRAVDGLADAVAALRTRAGE